MKEREKHLNNIRRRETSKWMKGKENKIYAYLVRAICTIRKYRKEREISYM
jgi:hypothetical protein